MSNSTNAPKPTRQRRAALRAIIHRLLLDGLPEHSVARITGETIEAIHRVQRNPPRRTGKAENIEWRPYFNPDAIQVQPQLKNLYEQCPTCGGRVIMPCVLCGTRAYQAAARS